MRCCAGEIVRDGPFCLARKGERESASESAKVRVLSTERRRKTKCASYLQNAVGKQSASTLYSGTKKGKKAHGVTS